MYIIFNKIREILYKNFSFHYDQIELQTELEGQLGMDSREMLEFLSELEENFNININLDDVDTLIEEKDILTIADIVEYLEKNKVQNQFICINS